jgi:hypothetical protein
VNREKVHAMTNPLSSDLDRILDHTQDICEELRGQVISLTCVMKTPAFTGLYTPGAHVLVDSLDRLLSDPVDQIVFFSFGYFHEIYDELAEFRICDGQLISLLNLL